MSAAPNLDLCFRAFAAYGSVEGVAITPLSGGLINETYIVEAPSGGQAYAPRAILQRVSPIFDPCVHEDIEAIPAHLQSRGMITPRLHRTQDGKLYADLGDGGIWRLMTFISGHSHSVMTSALAHPAGLLVGRFHVALRDLPHKFHFV